MRGHRLWNRREFLKSIGYSSTALAGVRGSWLTKRRSSRNKATPSFAYVGYGDRSAQGIQVFAIHEGSWTLSQTVASEYPSFLALHPNQQFLYAVNEIDSYRGLPSGSIQAFAIDLNNGSLTLLNCEPLSLSAIMPRHMAVSPDGRHLVVAVSGGGAYNVLPIGADGRLGRVSGIVKETGSGPNLDHQKASHPQMVVFDATTRHLLGTDLGSDRLNVFTLTNNKLTLRGRTAIQPGSGPHQMELHPNGHLLYVRNELERSVSCYGYDAANGTIQERLQHVAMYRSNSAGQERAGTMAIHPSGRYLYLSDHSAEADSRQSESISVWRINATNGALTQIESRIEGVGSPHTITMIPDGSAVLVLSQKSNSVLRLNINLTDGHFDKPVQVAELPTPMSLAVKYL